MNPTTQARIDRAASLIDNLCYDESYHESLLTILEALMKEQDRDTRHACAEAVSALAQTQGLSVSDVISIGHGACMNVQAL